ncbi:MAG: serine/threonine protein kinase [Deltaproteobacteria bacterium]|nr:serine/threonine protein kinase [Deltaproteobacteria bacterium]
MADQSKDDPKRAPVVTSGPRAVNATAIDPIDPRALAALKERQRRIQTASARSSRPAPAPAPAPTILDDVPPIVSKPSLEGPSSFDSLLKEFGAPIEQRHNERPTDPAPRMKKPAPPKPAEPAPRVPSSSGRAAVAHRAEVPKITPIPDPPPGAPKPEKQPEVSHRPRAIDPPDSARSDAMIFGPKYRVRSLIGEGATGMVYEAQHAFLDRLVAIKVLSPKSQDPRVIERFQREAKALGRIRDPGIIVIDDFDRAPDGRMYLVMERLVGEDLRAKLERERKLGGEEALEIGRSVADALSTAHAVGVVHRDLKPANVFLAKLGDRVRPKLLDFGTANLKDAAPLTQDGTVVGTPAYMSPEQVYGEAITERTDIHALSLVVYELLVGSHPFAVRSFEDTLTNVLKKVPDPLPDQLFGGLTAELSAVLAKGLEKDPAKRWATARELSRAFQDLLERNRVGQSESTTALAQPVVVPAKLAAPGANETAAEGAWLLDPRRRWAELGVAAASGAALAWLLFR